LHIRLVNRILEVDSGGRRREAIQVRETAALDQIQSILFATPALQEKRAKQKLYKYLSRTLAIGKANVYLSQIQETLYECLLLVGCKPVNKYRPLAKHIQQVQYGQNDVEIGRLEQAGQVFDGIVQMT
jgi:hypothetical protein